MCFIQEGWEVIPVGSLLFVRTSGCVCVYMHTQMHMCHQCHRDLSLAFPLAS